VLSVFFENSYQKSGKYIAIYTDFGISPYQKMRNVLSEKPPTPYQEKGVARVAVQKFGANIDSKFAIFFAEIVPAGRPLVIAQLPS